MPEEFDNEQEPAPKSERTDGEPLSEAEQESTREAAKEAAEATERRARRPHVILKRNIRPQQMFALIGGFGLFALELTAVISDTLMLHPIFPTALLIFFLYPFRKERIALRLIQLGVLTFLVWLFLNLSGVLFPFIMAFIIAYLFAPLVKRLENHGVPRWSTSLGVVLGILGVYIVIGIFVVPQVISQFERLLGSVREIFSDASSFLDRKRMIEEMQKFGIGPREAEEIITNQIEPQLRAIVTWLFGSLGSFLNNLTSIVEGVTNLILIPILSFYMLFDFRKIRAFVRSTLLQDNPTYVYYVRKVDGILISYLTGILLTSTNVGVLAVVILSLFNVPYAIVLGLLTGVFNLIPTLGMFLNLGVALVVFLFAPGDFWLNTLVMALMIFGLHALNAYFIEPRVLGDRVGLHPVLLIASLFIFAHFLGFVGLVIAVPATAIIRMFLTEWYQRTIALKKPVYTTSTD